MIDKGNFTPKGDIPDSRLVTNYLQQFEERFGTARDSTVEEFVGEALPEFSVLEYLVYEGEKLAQEKGLKGKKAGDLQISLPHTRRGMPEKLLNEERLALIETIFGQITAYAHQNMSEKDLNQFERDKTELLSRIVNLKKHGFSGYQFGGNKVRYGLIFNLYQIYKQLMLYCRVDKEFLEQMKVAVRSS